MTSPKAFYEYLSSVGINYFSGVPDSLLKTFCAYISDNTPNKRHVIASNEGAAVGLAMGYHLATGEIPLVYMQNSGLGNAINPLMSLVDRDVYSIPMILMIGWRGEPGAKDEPQHIKQGKVTLDTLNAIGIPFSVICGDAEEDFTALDRAVKYAKENNSPYALVVKKNSFDNYRQKSEADSVFTMTREEAIGIVVDQLENDDILVSTTGMASRELFEYREEKGQTHEKDFLTVGGMGHAASIAMGIASEKQNRKIVCIDGDGASIMHMGTMAVVAQSGLENFKHIVINNGAHDSVGGQKTIGFNIDFCKIAAGCGYKNIQCIDSEFDLRQSISDFLTTEGVCFLEIRVKKGNRADLGRPTSTPKENKFAFMEFLQ